MLFAEQVWWWNKMFVELSKTNTGCTENKLDPVASGRVFEKCGFPIPVLKRKQILKNVDLDADGFVSMLEWLMCLPTVQPDSYHYGNTLNVENLLTRPQGTNENLKKAVQAVEAVQAALDALEAKKKKLQAIVNSDKGNVKKLRAQNELDQIENKGVDNSILINAQAAVRKAQKDKSLQAAGDVWWLNRTFTEQQGYMPKGNLKR